MDTLTDQTPMTEQEYSSAIRGELDASLGKYNTGTKDARARGMDYYYRERPQKVAKPRTSLRSTDIPDVCDAMLAEIVPLFTKGKAVCRLSPFNPDDRQSASIEAKALNYVFFEECSGEDVIHDILMDGLLARNSVVHPEVIEDETVEIWNTGPISINDLDIIMRTNQARNPDSPIEVIDRKDIQEGVLDATLRKVKITKQLTVNVYPPENTFVCRDHDDLDLEKARFVAFLITPSRGELYELGVDYKTAYEDLKAWTDVGDYDQRARRRNNDEGPVKAKEKSGEKVECYRCFYRVDKDGDGIPELHDIIYGVGGENGQVLFDDVREKSHLSSFSPWKVPHVWSGTGLEDKLGELTEAKTVFLRQTADNAIKQNNPRPIYSRRGVEKPSVENPDSMAPIYAKDPHRDVNYLQIPDTGTIGYQMLTYLDKIRRERVGSSLDQQSSGSAAQMVPGDTAHGVERVMSTMEHQNAYVAQQLTKCLTSIFRSMHQLLRTTEYNPFVVPYERDTWLNVDPQAWPKRTAIIIDVGQTEGQKRQRLAALENVFQKQMTLMQQFDGILVTPENIYETLAEQASVAGLSDVDRYWRDPQSPEALQAIQQKQMMQQQMRAMQEQQMQEQKMLQQQMMQQQTAKDIQRARTEHLKVVSSAQNDAREQRLNEISERDESSREWTKLEIEADKDLGVEGKYK